MSTFVHYNGVMLGKVRVTEYSEVRDSNHNSPFSSAVTHQLTGEALVAYGTTTSSLRDMEYTIALIRDLLSRPHKALTIAIDPGIATQPLIAISAVPALSAAGVYIARVAAVAGSGYLPCDDGGPFFSFTMTQITGTTTCILSFTVTWTLTSSSEAQPTALQVSTAFSIDEVGATTIRRTGYLQMPRGLHDASAVTLAARASDTMGSTNTATTVNRYPAGDGNRNDIAVDFIMNAANVKAPDYYRRLISGNLERGFRRVRQDYVVDESRTRLMFDIVDQEFFGTMPAPAKIGNCEFAFERSLVDGSAVGTKHFQVTVTGDRDVTPGALLNLCIRMSQNRIDYALDTMQKIRVSQRNMLSENTVSYEAFFLATSILNFEVVGTENQQDTLPGSNETSIRSFLLQPILMSIPVAGSQFVFEPATMPDEYGAAGIVRVSLIPDFVGGNFPYSSTSTTTQLINRDNDGQNPAIYSFPDQIMDLFTPAAGSTAPWPDPRVVGTTIPKRPAGPNRSDLTKQSDDAEEEKNKHIDSSGNQTRVIRTNIVVVPSVGNGPSAVFQVGAPEVVITETVQSARPNEAPKRVMQDLPTNGVMVAQEFNVTAGRSDGTGNRILAANFKNISVQRYVPDPLLLDPTDFTLVPRTIDGETVSLIEYFPLALPLPMEPNQGADIVGPSAFAQPTYTPGISGTNTGYVGAEA